MNAEFTDSIKKHQAAFGLNLSADRIAALANYYEIVQKYNPLLHLVAPCSAEEFAVRHVLESLTLLEFLPKKVRFIDVGTGAGLPSIPCLLAREDLRAVLIESKQKKTDYLQAALNDLDLAKRAEVINRQFEEAEIPPLVSFVTCRALDKFTQKLPRLLKWARNRSLLFFGGNSLREELKKNNLKFYEKLMPLSEQRFLFVVKTSKSIRENHKIPFKP